MSPSEGDRPLGPQPSTRAKVVHPIFFLMLLAAMTAACALPGTASPTPFVFPTANLTRAAVDAQEPTVTDTPATPTSVVVVTGTPSATGPALATPSVSPEPDGQTRPNGRPVMAPRFDEPPTIDGELGDWPAERLSLTHVVFGAENWSGGSDLSGTYAVGWDSDSLYLAVRVNDDTFVQEADGRSMYQGDSLELLLDTELGADFSSNTLNDDDYQIGLSPGNLTGKEPEAYRWFPRAVEGALTSPRVAGWDLEGGYRMEVSMPWIVAGVEPVPSDCFGFALSLSDNDQRGSVNQQSMVSTVSTRNLTDPTSWGTLILTTDPVTTCRASDPPP